MISMSEKVPISADKISNAKFLKNTQSDNEFKPENPSLKCQTAYTLTGLGHKSDR